MKICLSCEGISDTELQSCGSCGTGLLPIEAVHYPLRRGEEDAGNPLLGSRVDGKFRVTNVLGKGGMGTVFRAVHEVSLVPVALKILHPRYAVRGAYREGFLAEARKAGRVIHENCARILDVGEAEDGTVYIAQELVEGETLDIWIHGGLAPATAVEILVQLCRALVAAHRVGLVHRDLSTRNIMVLLREGQPLVKVLDFGIAKGASAGTSREGESGNVPVTASFGNPAYSAPEQLAGRDVDARADLYSLGVIAYESLCGELPVEGSTGRELARATVEGNLKELPNLAGVPAQLHRLVERLLSLDPEERPASAAQVLGILERLRRPKDLGLKRIAVGLMIAAVVLITVAYTAVPPSIYLRLLGNQPIVLYEEQRPESPLDEVRSEEIGRLSFDFAGFDANGLRVQALLDSELLDVPLEPELDASGLLILSDDQPAYRDLLKRLAGEERAVNLIFRVEGAAPLGYARVLVDDKRPEVTLSSRDEGLMVRTGTTLEMSADDVGAVDTLRLELRFAGGEEIPFHPSPGTRTFPLGERLGELTRFAGAAPVEETVQAQLIATDMAGNEGESEELVEFRGVDLRAPAIEGVAPPGGGGRVTYDGRGATTLQLTLDDSEPGLIVRVTDPSGVPRKLETTGPPVGMRLGVRLEAFHPGREKLFEDGNYEFQLEDPAGNLSDWFPVTLIFRPRDVQPVFSSALDNVAVLEQLLVTDGSGATVDLDCNVAYSLEDAKLQPQGIGAAIPVEHTRIEAGRYRLEIGPLEDGRYDLTLTLRDTSTLTDSDEPLDVWVIGAPVGLRLPDTRGLRFLPELVPSVFKINEEDGSLEQGDEWNLTPPDWRLLQGELQFRTDWRKLAPRAAGGPLFRGLRPLPGINGLDLELTDVLGRPVRLFLGERGADAVPPTPDTRMQRVATFQYPTGLPSARLVRVEHGQPAHLVIDSPLPFEDRDTILLNLGQRLLRPQDVESADGGGSVLEFVVSFDNLDAATDGRLGLVPRTDYDAEATFEFPVSLQTPAGTDDIPLGLQTSRSLLPDVLLGDLEGGHGLPAPLAGLLMVPALAPETFPDPVSEDLSSRALYRPTPVIHVRDTQDVYLQEAELTRAQYEAAVRAFLDRPLGDRGEMRELVHAADSLGLDRLTEPELLPAALEGDAARWKEMLEHGDRPVTGLSFFQAYTVTRIVGLLVGENPDLLRLPLGVELEMAALGNAPAASLNGLRDVSRSRFVAAHEMWEELRDDPDRWPPTASESFVIGDFVPTGQGFRLMGLDFGVREWVLDLPYSAALERDEALLREWLSDHLVHVERALGFARGSGSSVDVGLGAHLAAFGVVRGLALGEPDKLVDGSTGGILTAQPDGPLPPSVPGVVRVLQLRRDGQDLLPGKLDPRLHLIGMRLAGGDEFVTKVRAR